MYNLIIFVLLNLIVLIVSTYYWITYSMVCLLTEPLYYILFIVWTPNIPSKFMFAFHYFGCRYTQNKVTTSLIAFFILKIMSTQTWSFFCIFKPFVRLQWEDEVVPTCPRHQTSITMLVWFSGEPGITSGKKQVSPE